MVLYYSRKKWPYFFLYFAMLFGAALNNEYVRDTFIRDFGSNPSTKGL
jgi:hypothetical protein